MFILRNIALTAILLAFAFDVSAQAMQSTSYRIQNDSLNIGGGAGTSSSYRLEDTAGEIATGVSSSSNYTMGAGYQQMQETYLALSSADDVALTPALGGITGGTSNGATVATATTDSYAGYQLSITASTSPAMRSSLSSIGNYAPAGADPDFSFVTVAGTSSFGFSPEGNDIPSRFKDNGSACNTGSSDTSLSCWAGLSTSAQAIASRTSSNHPLGTPTTIRFRVGIGSSAMQLEGTYTATTTLTLLAL